MTVSTTWKHLFRRAAAGHAQPVPENDGSAPAERDSLAQRLGLRQMEQVCDRPYSAAFVERVPIGFARRHVLLGLAADSGPMPVTIADEGSLPCLDVLSRYLGCDLEPILAPSAEVFRAINAAYQQQTGQADAMIETLDDPDVRELDRQLRGVSTVGREDLLDVASRAPVIKVVNLVLFEAVKALASDVHLQPAEDKLLVRLRIDGILFDTYELPKGLQAEVVSRVKVMGRMNIAEKRLAQDGRATVQVGDRIIDLRISSVPTSFGESVVIRLLDKSARLYTLDELGMPPEVLPTFRDLIRIEHGLLLVTGPTGSGKSTTLYAVLQEIADRQRHVVTLEDPIEYQLPGVNQIQVNNKKGMTFVSGLRSVLRQDPDIIMVGEIRDHETAVLAIQSALTGHLVFSTLHTNDAASAVTRLLDLGIEPYLVASSVIGVLAQRLVRRVCPDCGLAEDHPETVLAQLGADRHERVAEIRRHVGCDACRHTGYRGRVGIFELLTVNDDTRRHIQARDTAAAIKSSAVAAGMLTLRSSGINKMCEGLTTAEEIIRVTTRTPKA